MFKSSKKIWSFNCLIALEAKCHLCKDSNFNVHFMTCTAVSKVIETQHFKWKSHDLDHMTYIIGMETRNELRSSSSTTIAFVTVNIVTPGQGETVSAPTGISTPVTCIQPVQTTHQTSVHTSAARASLETSPQTVSQLQTHVPAQSVRDKYYYKVKIINPSKKSEVIVRELNNFTTRLTSVNDI